jgi:hypothetical protein
MNERKTKKSKGERLRQTKGQISEKQINGKQKQIDVGREFYIRNTHTDLQIEVFLFEERHVNGDIERHQKIMDQDMDMKAESMIMRRQKC